MASMKEIREHIASIHRVILGDHVSARRAAEALRV